jgi:hypothetical protein
MTTGIFITEERRKIDAFSRPIWALADGLLVRRGNSKAITGYASVARSQDCSVAVVRDQVQHRSVLDAQSDRPCDLRVAQRRGHCALHFMCDGDRRQDCQAVAVHCQALLNVDVVVGLGRDRQFDLRYPSA